jgi:hypothetical protein
MDRTHEHLAADDAAVTRPVTDRSRITGARPVARPAYADSPQFVESRSLDWHAVVASVLAGLATALMLVILGAATGLIAGDEGTSADDAAGILGAIGAWSVVAMVLGAFVGSLLGGRLARWLDRGSIGYHAFASWGLATLLTVALASLVSIGFATATNSAANTATAVDTTTNGRATDGAAAAAATTAGETDGTPEGTTGTDADSAAETTDETTNALGGAGLGLFLTMLLTLAASAGGWWIGSRKRLLDIEREPDDSRVAVA